MGHYASELSPDGPGPWPDERIYASRPLVLDLFSGEGIGARGYIDAGFDVLGVDLHRRMRKHYPGKYLVGDWRDMADNLRTLGIEPDLVHASPPCQAYSQGTVALDKDYPDLIDPVRKYLLAWGVPFVIENVERAPLVDAVTYCGSMFKLETDDEDGERLYLRRHRLFEAHGFELRPGWCQCSTRDLYARCAGVYGGGRTDKREAREVRHGGYTPKSRRIRAELMGISPDESFTMKGLSEGIPPIYAARIGHSFNLSRPLARAA